jgi:hypothetical protein
MAEEVAREARHKEMRKRLGSSSVFSQKTRAGGFFPSLGFCEKTEELGAEAGHKKCGTGSLTSDRHWSTQLVKGAFSLRLVGVKWPRR